jgi:transaldolase
MKTLSKIREIGQSVWIDEITRRMLDDGTLARYIALGVTGLTSNPTIFEKAIAGGDYDAAIRDLSSAGKRGEALFTVLALDDLRRAADLFRPAYDASNGVDGWVSMEVSPLLAHDSAGTIASAARIHSEAQRENLFVKIPGTPEGLPAIEQSIFDGIPINVTLLFSPEQTLAASEAYVRGIERRVAAGRHPRVESVASLFVSRWDKAVASKVPPNLRNRLGIAIARSTHAAHGGLFESPRWRALEARGARLQRLLMASTGVKDPEASPTLYVESLVAPRTVDTMPVPTLEALANLEKDVAPLQSNGGDVAQELERFSALGIDLATIALNLQREGADAFVTSWKNLMSQIDAKSGALEGTEKRRA